MARTYRRTKLANGRVPFSKTLIDNHNYNCFVKLYQNWKFNTDNQKVPNFKDSVKIENRTFRKEIKEELRAIQNLEDAESIVLSRVRVKDIPKEVWMYCD